MEQQIPFSPEEVKAPRTSVSETVKPSTVKKKTKASDFIIGLVITALAVTGIVSIVSACRNRIAEKKEAARQAEYESYMPYLIPAAGIDVTPFDDISSAPMSELIEMSVWAVLNGEMNPADYEYADGNLVISTAKTDAMFAYLFGNQITPVNQTVEGYGYEFTFDSAKSAYYIPLTTITPVYTPDISSVENKGSATTITCGFINSSAWSQSTSTGAMVTPAPDKFIRITLRSSGKSVYISAVQSANAPEAANPDMVSYETAAPVSTTVPVTGESQ